MLQPGMRPPLQAYDLLLKPVGDQGVWRCCAGNTCWCSPPVATLAAASGIQAALMSPSVCCPFQGAVHVRRLPQRSAARSRLCGVRSSRTSSRHSSRSRSRSHTASSSRRHRRSRNSPTASSCLHSGSRCRSPRQTTSSSSSSTLQRRTMTPGWMIWTWTPCWQVKRGACADRAAATARGSKLPGPTILTAACCRSLRCSCNQGHHRVSRRAASKRLAGPGAVAGWRAAATGRSSDLRQHAAIRRSVGGQQRLAARRCPQRWRSPWRPRCRILGRGWRPPSWKRRPASGRLRRRTVSGRLRRRTVSGRVRRRTVSGRVRRRTVSRRVRQRSASFRLRRRSGSRCVWGRPVSGRVWPPAACRRCRGWHAGLGQQP